MDGFKANAECKRGPWVKLHESAIFIPIDSLIFPRSQSVVSLTHGSLVGGISMSKQHGNREEYVAARHKVPQLSHEPLSVRSLQENPLPWGMQELPRLSGHCISL